MKVDIDSPPALTFDLVMEGKPIAAHDCPLFKIPTVVLTIIVNYLSTDNEVLASLALVNSDCRQLARSCQFRTVKFDFSPRAQSMLLTLQREVVERRRYRGWDFTPTTPTLSACIRRVLVNYNAYWEEISAHPGNPGRSLEDTSEDAYDDDENKLQRWLVFVMELSRRKNMVYDKNMYLVISGLVHLESLEISNADWNQDLLIELRSSHMKHLTIRELQMNRRVPVQDFSVAIPLESLNIHLGWNHDFSYYYHGPNLNASESWNTILRFFSASLKVLILSHGAAVTYKQNMEDTISFSLQFPQLHLLDLHRETYFDQSALRSLILTSPRLSALVINYGHQATRELLDREGHISSLETLVLSHAIHDIPDDSTFDFLKKNSHLKALGFHEPETSTVLQQRLSILTAFPQLKKLSMTWKGVDIPGPSLNALSKLSSLEILHLSSADQSGSRDDWPVRHEIIISRLKPLKNLIQVAFTRDMYSYVDEGHQLEFSYVELRHNSWDLHHQSMHGWSVAYAKAFPNLEFIHMGELSFDINRVQNGIELKTTEDEGFSWMRVMFGIPQSH